MSFEELYVDGVKDQNTWCTDITGDFKRLNWQVNPDILLGEKVWSWIVTEPDHTEAVKKFEQQCAQAVIHLTTDSKHRIISDALASMDCQGYSVSSSPGSKTKSWKCLLTAGKSSAAPWAPSVVVAFERIIRFIKGVSNLFLALLVGGRVLTVCLPCW